MQLLPPHTWREVKIEHGDMPGEMENHQYLTYKDNLYCIGGYMNGKSIRECFVFFMKSSEVQ